MRSSYAFLAAKSFTTNGGKLVRAAIKEPGTLTALGVLSAAEVADVRDLCSFMSSWNWIIDWSSGPEAEHRGTIRRPRGDY